MKPLEPPDTLHVEAAEGWLGLGNHAKADAVLDKVTTPILIELLALLAVLRWRMRPR